MRIATVLQTRCKPNWTLLAAANRKIETRATSLELFVGAGGLALGAAQTGFDHVAVIDWNRNACDTLRMKKAGSVVFMRDWAGSS